MKLFLFLFIAAIGVGSTVAAQEVIPKPVLLACKSAKGEDFTIELFRETAYGPMHCIKGLMIVDMTPCAPDGGWGLSYPTGTARIAEVTSMCAIAYRHFGGKFTATLGPEEFTAAASFGVGLEPDLSKGSTDMTVKLDRSTGDGTYVSGSLGTVKFHCEVKARKF